jgi:hypothetical protein
MNRAGLCLLVLLLAAPGAPGQASDFYSNATTYVPLDSWVYPALERLGALGGHRSAVAGMKPWTRRECARLVAESGEIRQMEGLSEQALRLLSALEREFAAELAGRVGTEPRAEMDSVYARVLGARGAPLEDAFHFGQALPNDFGRPLRAGANGVVGFSARGSWGPFSFHLQPEAVFSGAGEALPLTARQALATLNSLPPEPPLRPGRVTSGRLLESYMAASTERWTISFGMHNLRWGFARSGSLSLAENAQPIPMLRIARASPLELPVLGMFRGEFFFGRLSGHRYVRTENALHVAPLSQPWIHGGRAGLKPTPNLELGAGVTTVFGGPEAELSWRVFWRSFSLGNPVPGALNDPGDRRASFDVQYRVPRLRDWLTVYVEAMTEDEFSPVGYPRRSAFLPGFYLARLPGLQQVDLRGEGFWTDLPGDARVGVFFANSRYVSGFAHRGQSMGHVVGREGSGFELRSTWWREPPRTVEFLYRDRAISDAMLPGGGTVRTFGVEWRGAAAPQKPAAEMEWALMMQYEHWDIPVLSSQPRHSLVVGARLTALRPWKKQPAKANAASATRPR